MNVPEQIRVESPAFAESAPIPVVYGCKGRNVSPPLRWSGVPGGAAALALVVDDPDAPRGTYVHWIVLDIDPATTSVAEDAVPAGGVEARNSAGDSAYTGPCPPSGTHHYRFTVYALRERTGLPRGAERDKALEAISKAATARGRLVGTASH